MITVEEARRIIAEQISALPAVAVDLADACGRVLRERVVADAFYPSADRSMMDGYAIAADDPAERFRVIAEVTPGLEPKCDVSPGECVRIFTGGILPTGASQVIIQEQTRREAEWMIPLERSAKRFVRPRGAEATPGKVLLEEGTALNAPELAILAQVGVTQPSVSRSPSVTHIATGGELVDPGESPRDGRIRDTNSIMVRALVAECGGFIQAHTRTGDDLAGITAFAAAHPTDLLLISGGASVGDHDFGARALRELGYSIHFDKVNLRPGKPLTFGTLKGGAAFVIPGNPVSHFVCFHVAIRLALERLVGTSCRWGSMKCRLDVGEALSGDPRDTFWPARASIGNDGVCGVAPLPWSSSGDTFALAGCNALIRVRGVAHPGDLVPVHLLGLPN